MLAGPLLVLPRDQSLEAPNPVFYALRRPGINNRWNMHTTAALSFALAVQGTSPLNNVCNVLR